VSTENTSSKLVFPNKDRKNKRLEGGSGDTIKENILDWKLLVGLCK